MAAPSTKIHEMCGLDGAEDPRNLDPLPAHGLELLAERALDQIVFPLDCAHETSEAGYERFDLPATEDTGGMKQSTP
jgi:hypothetical protein